MKVLFRADSSVSIGTGHLMRCLTLADELAGRGAEVSFASARHPGEQFGLIAARGHAVLPLPPPQSPACSSDVRTWLGRSEAEDAEMTTAAMRDRPDWIVVDHYGLSHDWETRMRSMAGRVMAIDDVADRPHVVDLLLDHNHYLDAATRYARLVGSSCRQLLGPAYALLRPQFAPQAGHRKLRAGRVNRVLVFFGGVDAPNMTATTLRALASVSNRSFAIDVVIGSANPHAAEVAALCASTGATLHARVTDMAGLMGGADLSIGASGVTTLERCAVGLPAILVTLADNQVDIARAADASGAAVYLGTSEEVDEGRLEQALLALLREPEPLADMSRRALTIVDGLGVARVADVMEALK